MYPKSRVVITEAGLGSLYRNMQKKGKIIY